MNQNNRVEWIDVAKGLGITLVSFGHLSNGDGEAVWLPALSSGIAAIYLFHMPLFYFLGGLTFSRRGGFKAFLIRKAKTLLIPYFIFSLYFVMKPLAVILLPALSHTFRSSHNYSSVGRQLYDVFIMGNGLWFLMAFFVGEVVMYGLTTLFQHRFSRGGVLLSGIVLIVLSFVNDSGLYHSIVLPFQIIKGLQVAGFMALGFIARKALFSMTRPPAALMAFALIVIYIVSTAVITNNRLPQEALWFLKMIAAVSGAVGFTMLCIVIKNNSILAKIGRDSLVFYAVNALSLNVAKLVMFRLFKIDATHWVFAGQLLMGLITMVLAMFAMFAVDVFIQKYLWWSIGKPCPTIQLDNDKETRN